MLIDNQGAFGPGDSRIHPARSPSPCFMKHGYSDTPEYKAWRNMIKRCAYKPDYPDYKYYGAYGVTIYAPWKRSFMEFFGHIGPRPSELHSLDRFPDNNGNYEPGNVRWATASEQVLNRRPYAPGHHAEMARKSQANRHRWIEAFGKRRTLEQWAALCGVHHATIHYRIRRGWTIEQAVQEARAVE